MVIEKGDLISLCSAHIVMISMMMKSYAELHQKCCFFLLTGEASLHLIFSNMNKCRKQWVIDRAVEDSIAIELQNIRFYVFFHGYVIQLNKYK